MSKASNVLIQRLLTAEEEAEKIVSRARENRTKKLKEAAASAEREILLFKSKEEADFKKEFQEKFGQEDNTNADLEEVTKKEIEFVKRDYKTNKEQVIQYLIKRSMQVEARLEPVQERFINESNEGRGASYV